MSDCVCRFMESAQKNEKNGMFFVDLKETQSDGSAWTTEAQEKLTSKWNSVRLHPPSYIPSTLLIRVIVITY